MVTAPAEALAPPHAVAGHALRGGAPGRAAVPRRAEQPHEPMALVQRQRRILQLHKERWPWSLTPREDARVPAPHEAPKTDSSPMLRRLSERTAALWRNNQQLQRRLAALQAETYAALAKKAPASSSSSSMGVLSPPSSPDSTTASSSPCSPPPSSLPSSPASSCWSSPPASPAGSEGGASWRFGLPYSPSLSPSSPSSPDAPSSPDYGA